MKTVAIQTSNPSNGVCDIPIYRDLSYYFSSETLCRRGTRHKNVLLINRKTLKTTSDVLRFFESCNELLNKVIRGGAMGGVFSMKGKKVKYGTFRFIGKVLKK